MRALQDGRLHEQYRNGRIRRRPPGDECGLGVAQIARIAIAAGLFDAKPGDMDGQRQIAWTGIHGKHANGNQTNGKVQASDQTFSELRVAWGVSKRSYSRLTTA